MINRFNKQRQIRIVANVDNVPLGAVQKGIDENIGQILPAGGADFLDVGTIPGVEMYPYDYMHLSPDAHRALAGELAKRILTRYNDSGVRPLS